MPRAGSVVDAGEPEPAVQAGLGDPEVLRDLGQPSLTLAGNRDDIAAELQGKAFGMMTILPARNGSSQTRSQPSWGQSRALFAARVLSRRYSRLRSFVAARGASSR
jgi:hypothetical protein